MGEGQSTAWEGLEERRMGEEVDCRIFAARILDDPVEPFEAEVEVDLAEDVLAEIDLESLVVVAFAQEGLALPFR